MYSASLCKERFLEIRRLLKNKKQKNQPYAGKMQPGSSGMEAGIRRLSDTKKYK